MKQSTFLLQGDYHVIAKIWFHNLLVSKFSLAYIPASVEVNLQLRCSGRRDCLAKIEEEGVKY